MQITDISISLDTDTTVFPGDPQPALVWPGWTHEKGNPANVGFYSGGLHHGTHVDAPWHFIPDGKRLHELPLERWVGLAQVLDLTTVTGGITAAVLAAAGVEAGVTRLLFKTRNGATDYWREPFNPAFIHIEKSGAQWCVDRGIKLVGLDYLTIDPPSEPTFPAHLALLGNDILILENIRLRHVPAGRYVLHAAPINLRDADGGWCRAYLTH